MRLLEKASEYFNQNTFLGMNDEKRKNLAGINKKNDDINDWRLFGGMNMARLFVHRIQDKKMEISKSLDHISLINTIAEVDYQRYIRYFQDSPSWGYGVSTISRLLAMKRPDDFFCLTAANQIKLMESFGISKKILITKDYTRYWTEIIEPVRESPWYNSVTPTNETELKAWKGRTALMDALFYDE